MQPNCPAFPKPLLLTYLVSGLPLQHNKRLLANTCPTPSINFCSSFFSEHIISQHKLFGCAQNAVMLWSFVFGQSSADTASSSQASP